MKRRTEERGGRAKSMQKRETWVGGRERDEPKKMKEVKEMKEERRKG